MTAPLAHAPDAVLAAWSGLGGATFGRFASGLINDTWRVECPRGGFVLQRLHPVFAGTVNDDIDALTTHLAGQGLVTPRVVRTDAGTTWVEHEGRPWRLLTLVPGGHAHDRVESLPLARSAGELVGRFHAALGGFEHRYAFTRTGVHDIARHLTRLEGALSAHRDHRLFEQVAPLAGRLLEQAAQLPALTGLPRRHIHGDLKISNLLFTPDERGLCLVDLDTIASGLWAHEMGDALRSWCNPLGEDTATPRFSTETFAAAMHGYAPEMRERVGREEREPLPTTVAAICLGLASRFLTDALEESYFGWNPGRFATRGEHNLLRARGQAALAGQVLEARSELERCVDQAFTA